jgi:hypothetical protein
MLAEDGEDRSGASMRARGFASLLTAGNRYDPREHEKRAENDALVDRFHLA